MQQQPEYDKCNFSSLCYCFGPVRVAVFKCASKSAVFPAPSPISGEQCRHTTLDFSIRHFRREAKVVPNRGAEWDGRVFQLRLLASISLRATSMAPRQSVSPQCPTLRGVRAEARPGVWRGALRSLYLYI